MMLQFCSQDIAMNTKRVLIVEDDASVLYMLKAGVKMCCPNFEVESASNGSAALDRLRHTDSAQEFDLILTDYNMPLMNGLELARVVRDKWPAVRIVLMTGSPDGVEFQREINALNLDGYVKKPFGMDILAQILAGSQPQSGPDK